jgi:DNA-binding SARP family transcriptional activator
MHLWLAFLGPFQVTLEDQPAVFATDRARALLAYLAVEADRPHRREALAGLLWPDRPESTARQNLSQSLARVRRAIDDHHADPPFLRITSKTVQVDAATTELDVARFQALLTACAAHPHPSLHSCPACIARMEQAAGLYRDEFLRGLLLKGSQPFDEWALLKRERLHRQALDVLRTLTLYFERQGAYEQMQRYAERQLALEPWGEGAHRQLMRALALGGQRGAALAQYETCRRVLADELGAEPGGDTIALYQQLRGGELAQALPRASGHAFSILGLSRPQAPTRHHWGEAPTLRAFHGRQAESCKLARWLVHDDSRLIALLGMGGIGKTSLAATVARGLADQFDHVLWCSLRNAPPLDQVLRRWLPILAGHTLIELPDSADAQMTLLIDRLRGQRCLLVLDNVESILQGGERAGRFRPGYKAYGQLFQRVGESEHQGCLLLTSRERPKGLGRLEDRTPRVHSLRLRGLATDSGQELLQARGLSGPQTMTAELVECYSGHPLALELVTRTVHELFDGDIAAFLRTGTPILDDLRDVLDQQFARLSALEREILIWLALKREGASIEELVEHFARLPARWNLLAGLHALRRRSLVERNRVGFSLQSVVKAYVTSL